MKTKLKSKYGETLVESLTALLVIMFVSMSFYAMLGVSNKINLSTKKKSKILYDESITSYDSGQNVTIVLNTNPSKSVVIKPITITKYGSGLKDYVAPDMP